MWRDFSHHGPPHHKTNSHRTFDGADGGNREAVVAEPGGYQGDLHYAGQPRPLKEFYLIKKWGSLMVRRFPQ